MSSNDFVNCSTISGKENLSSFTSNEEYGQRMEIGVVECSGSFDCRKAFMPVEVVATEMGDSLSCYPPIFYGIIPPPPPPVGNGFINERIGCSPDIGVISDHGARSSTIDQSEIRSQGIERVESRSTIDLNGGEDTGYASVETASVIQNEYNVWNGSKGICTWGTNGVDIEQLREMLAESLRLDNLSKELRKSTCRLAGVGQLLAQLRAPPTEEEATAKERTILDDQGRRVDSSIKCQPHIWKYPPNIIRTEAEADKRTKPIRLQDGISLSSLPAPPPRPTDPEEIRKLFRSKMVRCKKCKARFIEKKHI